MTLPPQPHRLSTCHRHPSIPITGFCALCLTDRLAGIESSTSQGTPTETTLSAADLRRTKSYSGAKRGGIAGIPEPRRNSCDVRARNTLWDLFHIDSGRGGPDRKLELRTANLGLELKEEDEEEEEIRVSEVISSADADVADRIVEKVDEFDEGVEVKSMKEHIDLEWQSNKNAGRDLKDIAGSFWQAASVFSRKLKKWRGKQKMKKASGGGMAVTEAMKPNPGRFRETQSEVGDYGLGRRSCDTDPRMSLDAGRISCDDVRFSFDEARASWDGCLIGKAYPRLTPLGSVVEDVKAPVSVGGCEDQSPVLEKMKTANEEHRSLDRRAPGREVEEVKPISDAKVTPETIGLFHGAKLLITERELMESNWNQPSGSHSSESTHSGADDIAPIAAGVAGRKGFMKLHRWHKVWNIWGSIQKDRHSDTKCEGEEKCLGGEGSGAVSQKLMRTYSVSSRNSYKMAGLVHNLTSIETKNNRNRSASYSPTSLDNGLLRFYLTPSRNSRSKSGKSRLKNSHSLSRQVL